MTAQETQVIFFGLTVVFAAGIVYNKVNNVDKKIDQIIEDKTDHEKRITTLEVDVKNIKGRE